MGVVRKNIVVVAGLLAGPAFAGTPALAASGHQLALPAQSLAASLQSVGEATGASVAFNPATVNGLRAPAIRGNYEAREALQYLIHGSGLQLEEAPGGTFVVKQVKPVSVKVASSGLVPAAYHTVAQPAEAPSAPPASQPAASAGLQDIVVTAQKREENLQDTPISIAALGSAALEARGIRGIQDLMGGQVPSLRMLPIAGRSSMMAVGIRGLASADVSSISVDPVVGIYIDGVYLGRTQGLGSELFEVERIEVARGPQGTLFGRNALGGAVSIVSKKPTGELGLTLDGGISNFGGHRVAGHLDLPRFANFSVKLDGVWSNNDGWVVNTLPTAWNWNQSKKWGVHAAILWQPAPGFDVEYSYDRSTDKTASSYEHIVEPLSSTIPLPPMFGIDHGRQSVGRMGVPLEPGVGRIEGHSLHVNWETSEHISVKSITAYRKVSQSAADNSAGAMMGFTPGGITGRYSLATMDQDQFSEELQLLGTWDHLDFVAGAFYFNEDASDWAYAPFTAMYNQTGSGIILLDPPVGGPSPDRASVNHTKSYALYAQGTYTPPVLDNRLHLTAGLRWTHDKKHGTLTSVKGQDTDLSYTFSSSRVDPAATVAFDLTDSVNTYVHWGRAYRAGGANSRSPTFRTFAPETLSSWELGVKSELFDRRARINLAAFSSRLQNHQVVFSNPLAGSVTETMNVPGIMTIKGVEADISVAPFSGLELTGSYTWLDINIPRTLNPFTGEEQRIVMVMAPSHAFSLGADYHIAPFSVGTVTFHADANYSGSFYNRTDSLPGELNPPYWLVNGRITVGDIPFGPANLSVSLWGKNLTNTTYHTYDFPLVGPGIMNAEVAWLNEPRSYGVDLRLRF